jgi:AcrR family transcriptional regulator
MHEESRNYHHGDLPDALLSAVDELVREGGVGAVTLREAARRAAVSHAAPAHHFGDKAGLLTEFAAGGFEALRARMQSAAEQAEVTGESPLFAIGLAYVAYAVDEPARFAVMFRPEHVLAGEARYRDTCDAAFGVLLDAVRAVRTDLAPDDPELMRAAAGAWSIVHGFATLWLDGNLAPEITAHPPAQAAGATLQAWAATLLAAGSHARPT